MKAPDIFGLMLLFVMVISCQPSRPPEWKADWYQVNWEREKFEKKIPTDTIYIHHTGHTPGITWQDLSALQFKTLYVPRYKSANKDPYVKGQEPYSGHVRYEGGVLVQVFYAYQWLVRQGGTVERLLPDTAVGWESGDWDENMRSVAICFDGDYSNAPPTDAALQAAGKLIAAYAIDLPIKRIKAHYETNKKTVCPGKWFDEKGPDGLTGRQKLLKFSVVQLKDEGHKLMN